MAVGKLQQMLCFAVLRQRHQAQALLRGKETKLPEGPVHTVNAAGPQVKLKSIRVPGKGTLFLRRLLLKGLREHGVGQIFPGDQLLALPRALVQQQPGNFFQGGRIQPQPHAARNEALRGMFPSGFPNFQWKKQLFIQKLLQAFSRRLLHQGGKHMRTMGAVTVIKARLVGKFLGQESPYPVIGVFVKPGGHGKQVAHLDFSQIGVRTLRQFFPKPIRDPVVQPQKPPIPGNAHSQGGKGFRHGKQEPQAVFRVRLLAVFPQPLFPSGKNHVADVNIFCLLAGGNEFGKAHLQLFLQPGGGAP